MPIISSRDELTKWDEHPWSTAAYIKEGFPVCGVDPAVPKNCTYCPKMHDTEQKARLARARTNLKNFKEAIDEGKDWNPKGGHPAMYVCNARDARRHVDCNFLCQNLGPMSPIGAR